MILQNTMRNSEERLPRVLAINNINAQTPEPLSVAAHFLNSQEPPFKLLQLDRDLFLLSASQALAFDDFDSFIERTERPPRF
jgi:hypothetical protein